MTDSAPKITQAYLKLWNDPWYHAVAPTIACDIAWGMGLVTPVTPSSNHPPLVHLRSTVEKLTMERLQLGASTLEPMQRWLYRRFASVSIWEETGRFEGSNEIHSTNGSCERRLAHQPPYGQWPHLRLSWVLPHHH